MRITDIRFKGNEHGELKQDQIYAFLRNDNGDIRISGTLDFILGKIRDNHWAVEGVAVSWGACRGANCSTITLDRY